MLKTLYGKQIFLLVILGMVSNSGCENYIGGKDVSDIKRSDATDIIRDFDEVEIPNDPEELTDDIDVSDTEDATYDPYERFITCDRKRAALYYPWFY
jgi:hypothetical protein